MQTVRLAAVCIFLFLPNMGCGVVNWRAGADSPSQSPAVEIAVSSELITEKESPINLEITQAFVESDILHITIHLRPLTELSAKDVAVSVVGLKEGEVLAEQQKWLSDAVQSDVISEGQLIALRYELPAGGLTEYQVKCHWGEDARKLAKVDGSEGAAPQEIITAEIPVEVVQPVVQVEPTESVAVRVETVRLEKQQMECDTAPCDFIYTLTSRLINSSGSELEGVQLGLGLYWASQGSEPVVPQPFAPLTANEELLDLSTLRLAVGGDKTLRITVDRPVPEISGGSFVPHLRVVKVGSTGSSSTLSR